MVRVVLLAGAFAVASCGQVTGSDDDAQFAEAAALHSVFELEVGMCFDRSPTDVAGGEEFLSQVVVVDCDTNHEFEVYAVFEVREGTDPSFPGLEQLQDDAAVHCGAAFEQYVGRSYAHSEFVARFITPTEASWQQNDRTAACYLTSQEGSKAGSARDSDR